MINDHDRRPICTIFYLFSFLVEIRLPALKPGESYRYHIHQEIFPIKFFIAHYFRVEAFAKSTIWIGMWISKYNLSHYVQQTIQTTKITPNKLKTPRIGWKPSSESMSYEAIDDRIAKQ